MAERTPLSTEDPKTENLAKILPDEELKKIGGQIRAEYDMDVQARSSWEKGRDRYYKLWLGNRQPKSDPFPNASNVCLPILSTACNQFHARSYQAFFSPPSFVKAVPVGANDKGRARNVEQFMNWQIMNDMENYEEETDKLLLNVPIGGSNFKKVYYDPENERPVSEYVSGLDIIIPYRTKSMETRRRLVHRFWLHHEEIKRRGVSKLYEHTDNIPESGEMSTGDMPSEQTKDEVEMQAFNSQEKPRLFLECHKLWKTSKDDKEIPYIFTVDHSTGIVVRATRAEVKAGGKTIAIDHFVHYGFIPNPEGFYTFGLGHFLEQLNEMANTAFNQIFDAGRLSNQPFGFYGRRSGIKRQQIRLFPGVMTEVEDASQIYFPQMQRLDQSLFQVLGMINQFAERFTSTSDYILGRENKGTKTPTATGTMAIIEQGLITFNIMTKRLFRSLRKELRTIYVINQAFLPKKKQFQVQESEEDIAFKSINRDDFDGVENVVPIGDPSFASKMTRRQEAMELYSALMQNPLVGIKPPDMQLANPRALWEITRDFIESYDKKYIHRFLPKLEEPSLDPEAENALVMQGELPKPKKGEDHIQHLKTHLKFKETDYYREMNDEKKELLDEHIEATRALMYLEMQERQAMGSLGAEGEPAPPGAPVEQPEPVPMQQPPMPMAEPPVANGMPV